MAGSTATRSRAKAPANGNGKLAKVTPDDFLRVTQFLDTRVLVERAVELRVILLGTLAGVNVHLLGPPGVAKSLGLREFAKCVTDARYFEKAMNAGLPPDAVIGAIDIQKLTATGEYARKVDGMLPLAHIGFVDEWFRSNGLMLDALLPIANTEERFYEANGQVGKSPLLVLVSASNHMPDADNEQAQALVDRITLMAHVDRVRADDSFMEIVRRHHARRTAEAAGTYTRETVTLEQLIEAQRQVTAIEPSPDFLAEAAALRRRTYDEGLGVSDRRWVELFRVCRANAWLSGRDHLIPEDLAATEHGLWRAREDIPKARALVMPFFGRFEREATERRQEWVPVAARWEAVRPQVEGTPPNQDLDPDVLKEAISIARSVVTLTANVDSSLAAAAKEHRDAASLRDLANELLATRDWFDKVGLGVAKRV